MSSKQAKNLVVQLRLTEEQYEGIRRAAEASALDPATWMRMSLVRDAAREAPKCWCGSELGVHRVPHVKGLVGDRCLRATDWKIFAAQLSADERRALLNRVAEICLPRRPPSPIAKRKDGKPMTGFTKQRHETAGGHRQIRPKRRQ